MSEQLKKQIWLFVGILIIVGSFYLFFSNQKIRGGHQVVIDGIIINVELAQTEVEREQGLSGHKPLEENEGMLFIFERPGFHGFWMKDMLFAIDIIWLAPSEIEGNAKIVHIERNLSPDTYPKIFGPNNQALYVLEVNAGFAEKNNWVEGDEVKL